MLRPPLLVSSQAFSNVLKLPIQPKFYLCPLNELLCVKESRAFARLQFFNCNLQHHFQIVKPAYNQHSRLGLHSAAAASEQQA